MRIIRVSFAILGLILAITPQTTLAYQNFGPNETQINSKIQNKIANSQIISSDEISSNSAQADFEGFSMENSSDPEIFQRKQILQKFEKKGSAAILPKDKFVINASAYTAAADECGKSDGITASGLKVKEKETIACPSYFPFGTKLKIENMGTYICEDRGGAIKGNHIDIYMETKKEAFAFGRKNLIAEIVL